MAYLLCHAAVLSAISSASSKPTKSLASHKRWVKVAHYLNLATLRTMEKAAAGLLRQAAPPQKTSKVRAQGPKKAWLLLTGDL